MAAILRARVSRAISGFIPLASKPCQVYCTMSAMHPLRVNPTTDGSPKDLKTYEQIRDHFLTVERNEFEQFVYVSLLLLRAKVSTLLK